MRTAWRFGLLYLLALLLVFALGHRNQVERAHLHALESQLQKLQAQEEALLKEGWRASQPHRVLEWAKEEGFVPMSQGRWGP
ncbi:MAG: hypothetical protein NZ846_08830 [Thermus sp.]|uniref:hypothetical protein n=1 Tax=Thermus sp. TaxID=275 RepID=UPI0025D9A117|nr:hypothetical protein [Thermus sp.]MCS6869176.1 hypothetical protein [Thermus sp.]MCS7219060.1 hypothetical protein [Thermus sp.]MDW8017395.1 hypothetical protein [Thermus sp.]MDW8357315.1 hypothetical protein [Thermus sp.]